METLNPSVEGEFVSTSQAEGAPPIGLVPKAKRRRIVREVNFRGEDEIYVATLALGLRPKQGFARVRAKREAWESHLMLPGV
jgi:hypothetical protein